MEKKRCNKWNFRFLLSFSLILSILISSIPFMPVYSYAETNYFEGLEDIEVEENTEIDLLEKVSAHLSNGEELQIRISNIVCETDNNYQYDGTNRLNVGKAGSSYRVEYTATLLENGAERYTAYRTITSIAAKGSETVEIENQVAEESLDEVKFDEKRPFTLSNLENTNYKMEMDNAQISTEHFELECIQAQENESIKDPLNFGGIQTIRGGKLKNNVPPVIENTKGQKHSYIKAHVENVQVYYVGKLLIEDQGEQKEYIYYTTDTQITNKTVYAVLKLNEKITLSYSHNVDYTISYQFKNKTGQVTEKGPNDWSYDEVFGEYRAITGLKNQNISNKISIPRGYKATITAVDQDNRELYKKSIGEMMKYEHPLIENSSININKIKLVSGSPDSVVLTDKFSIKGATSDITITVQYEEIENVTFNAKLWTDTVYAKDRISVNGSEKPNNQNSILTSSNHTFSWEFDGITSSSGGYWNTWEMDQLEINGETIIVPMTTLADKTPKTIVTTLSTGTEVKLTVISKGGENGNGTNSGRRHYELQISNCYEDVTISGGNMVSHHHQEYAINILHGVRDGGFYAYDNISKKKIWSHLKQDTLIGKKGQADNSWEDPMRFKRQYGFYTPDISFTTKNGEELQKNGEVKWKTGNNNPYIEYLIRTDSSEDIYVQGNYRVVSFEDWKVSSDGYYYFRGTKKVEEFANKSQANGVILINIVSKPIKLALDYKNGNDSTGKKAPVEENIANLPEMQRGGMAGYNVDTNPTVLVSNRVPVDKTNEFVFDHWEVLEATQDAEHPLGYVTDLPKLDEQGNSFVVRRGDKYELTTDFLQGLDRCFYFEGKPKDENGRAVLTIRAVWKKHYGIASIPYSVRYVLADVKNGQIDKASEQIIEEHFHTVNEGAMLITDLYQDGNKTLSEHIQRVLEGANQSGKDYTQQGKDKWVVYEPNTTKVIESVNLDNNIAIIYLIKGNIHINVEKIWNSQDLREPQVKVQLQRRRNVDSPWEQVEIATLSDKNNWKYTFDGARFFDILTMKQYEYRVSELDENNQIIENGQQIVLNDNSYQVEYAQDVENNTWVIKNNRLLDLTINKVVEGGYGNQKEKFTFVINLKDSTGKPVEGNIHYIGGVKEGYESESTKLEDGNILFKGGIGEIKLSHGQQIRLQNLPFNSEIVITEQNTEGYITQYIVNGEKKALAQLNLIQNSVVDVKNAKSDIPSTGLTVTRTESVLFITFGIFVLMILGYFKLSKRREREK